MSNLKLTAAQLTVVSQVAGCLSSAQMSRRSLKIELDNACTEYTERTRIDVDKIPLATIPLIFGAVCGVELYIEPETFAERVHAYINDVMAMKADGTVDKIPTARLVSLALGTNEHDVRLIMGGAAGVQADQESSRTMNRVYRKTREQKSDGSVSLPFNTLSMCTLFKHWGLSPETIADIIEVYERPEAKWMVRGILYRWQAPSLAFCKMRIPKAAVRAIISALVQVMPQPVEMIRQQLVHGTDEQPQKGVNIYHPEFLFTEEMNTIIRLAMFITQPYADQKISNEERVMTGDVYERSLYRHTDMGQQGRRFSLSDRTDILDRTIIMSFCPLICRSVPVTDKGSGLVIMPHCTVEQWMGKWDFTIMRSARMLTAQADRLRLCRDRGYKMKQGKRIPFTEQMYNEQMSKLPEFPADRPYTEEKKTVNAYFTRYTCTQTGQQFTVPTTSVSRAAHLASLTGVIGELDTPIVYTSTSGPFGDGDLVQNDTMLIPTTVREYRPEGVFFRSLRYVTRSIFQFLFRRPVGVEPMLDEHKYSKCARRNAFAPFSLYNLLNKRDEFAGISIQLTTEEEDMMEAELTLPEHLPRAGRGMARTAEYCRRREARTGHECILNRDQYRDLKKQLFASILVKIESWQELYTVQQAAPMEPGPGLFEQTVDRFIEIPNLSGCTFVPGNSHNTRGTVLMDSSFRMKGMIRRTWEECRELDNNPRIHRYTEHREVVLDMPCWTDEQHNLYIPESTHDDVCV